MTTPKEDTTIDNGCVEYTPTRLEKLGWKLFPPKMPSDPDPEGKARDLIIHRTITDFSFADRLRILLSGRVTMESRIATENVVGGNRATAIATVNPPAFLRR